MNNEMKNIIYLPYPVSNSNKEILFSSLFISLAGFLFLSIFQPFGTYIFSHPFKYILLTPYSLISFLVFTAGNFLLKNKSNKWNMLKESIKIFCILIVCSIFNYTYNIQFINHTDFNVKNLISMFIYTVSAGTPICIIYVLVRYLFLKKKGQLINQPETSQIIPDCQLSFKPDVGKYEFKLSSNDFLFAEAEGNYCNIFYLENGILQKQLLRLSLKNLEIQANCKRITRCHRSFVINMDKITNTTGNTQGYKLTVENSEKIVPVSRKYIQIFENK